MKIIFSVLEKSLILDFELIDYEMVRNKHIYEEAISRMVLKDPKCNVNKDSLLKLLKFYMGGNGTLEEYIAHIKNKGFYTPYQPNLCIRIEDEE